MISIIIKIINRILTDIELYWNKFKFKSDKLILPNITTAIKRTNIKIVHPKNSGNFLNRFVKNPFGINL